MSDEQITFGSLFTGFGGMDLGLERAGMKCDWQVEKDTYANRVLRKHWPDVQRFRDIKEVGETELRQVDLICGGDPCQAHSSASGSWGSRRESLGGEFIRIVDELRPRIVLRENPSSARRDAEWTWWRFRGELESLGYAVLPFRLRACCFGCDHQRDRLFLLAEMADTNGLGMGFGGAPTKAQENGRNEHNRWPRADAPAALRAPNGFPKRLERNRGLGNAVVPRVAEWIGRRIVESQKSPIEQDL